MLDGQDPHPIAWQLPRWILNEEIARVEFQSARFHLIDIDGVDSLPRLRLRIFGGSRLSTASSPG